MENQDQRESNLYPEYQNYQAGGSPASSRQNGQPANGLATASLVMGILAVVMTCFCYGGLIFGGLGVLFALLSKGNGPMSGRARAGLGLSLGGLILTAFLWGMFLIAGFSGYGGSFEFSTPEIPRIPDPEFDLPENLVAGLRQLFPGKERFR